MPILSGIHMLIASGRHAAYFEWIFECIRPAAIQVLSPRQPLVAVQISPCIHLADVFVLRPIEQDLWWALLYCNLGTQSYSLSGVLLLAAGSELPQLLELRTL